MVKVKRGALLLRDGDGKWVEHRAVAKLRSPPNLVLSLQSNNGSASVVALKVRVATVEATSADGGFCVTARTAGGDAGATTELRAAPKPAKGRSAADVRDSWLRFLRRTPPPPKQKHHRHTKTDGASASASASASAAVDNGDSHPPSYSPVDTSLPSTPLQARRGPLLQRSAEETQSTGALLPAAAAAAPTPLVPKPIVAGEEDEGEEDAVANSPPRTPRRGALWKSMVEGPPATAPRPATHGPTGGADEAAVASPTPLRRTHSDESMLELTPMTAAAAAAASKQQHRRRRTRVGDVAGLQPVLLGDAARVWHSEHPDEPAPTVAKKWRRSQHYGAHAGHGGHRRPVKQFKVNEMGEIIYKSHPSWVLMHQMQIGIRHCIVNERLREEEVALLRSPGYWHRSEFFSTPEIIRFPAAGSEDTVRHALGDFKFKNYMPLVFRYARGIFGIERSDYVASLCHSTERDENPLRLMATPGKSGSLFFFSQDMRFLIKTIPKSEARLLRSIMPPYIEHITRNPNTLLPRFYGLHRVKPHRGRQVRFVIMANNFATGLKIHERFDLKGSMLGRYVSPAERAIKGRNATLKEGNLAELGRILQLGSGRRERFLSQLHKDAEFLRDLGIMDYSLLVGIHYDAVAQKEKGKEAAIAAAAAAMASTSPAAPPAAPPAAAPSYTVTDLTSTSAASSTSKSVPSAEPPPAPSSPRPQAPFPRESTESERLRPEFFTMGVDLQPQAATVQRAIEADIVSLPISDQLLTIEHDDLRPAAAAPSEWYCEEGGMAGRDAEGRPVGEHYFLGVIDILMFYTARKAAERMYKTLRYRGKGEVSSCPPAQYADRFVRYISSVVQ